MVFMHNHISKLAMDSRLHGLRHPTLIINLISAYARIFCILFYQGCSFRVRILASFGIVLLVQNKRSTFLSETCLLSGGVASGGVVSLACDGFR